MQRYQAIPHDGNELLLAQALADQVEDHAHKKM